MWKGLTYPWLSGPRLVSLGSAKLCCPNWTETGQAGLILQDQVG